MYRCEVGGCNRLITSGNLISVKNALAVGGFDEGLFIDEVDYDFCYKGLEHGMKMFICLDGIWLLHSVGNTMYRRMLGHTFKCMNHGKVRKYYIVRNRCAVAWKHRKVLGPAWVLRYVKQNLRSLFDVIFFEEYKKEKLAYMLYGFCDFLRGKTGKVY